MNVDRTLLKERGVTWLTLLTSTGTLVCCALPIILVTLGLGATVAALTSAFSFLITLSQQKVWVFTLSGTLLGAAGWLMYRPGRTCPADTELAQRCTQTQIWNRRIFCISLVIWVLGFIAAYLALPIWMWLGG